jgi:predicted 3-demethylubiquinone-9 3-methyltransferase (glyoxalase superfamily)
MTFTRDERIQMRSQERSHPVQKITPFLWFDDRLEDAVNFYTSVFPNAKVTNISRYGDAGPLPAGTIMTATFELEGQEFMALNGGPEFTFNEAVSFFVKCENQAEIDSLWNKLTADGGSEQPCGWLKDKFGLSWQIIPNALGQYLGDPDPAKAQRVMQAMLQMKKIDVAALEKAYAG